MIALLIKARIWSHKPGFTLVEMLLVVILLGVIAVLALPNFSRSFEKLQLQSTANDLAFLLRYAQGRAITKNHKVQVSFDQQFKSYWLTETSANEDAEDLAAEEKFNSVTGRWGRVFLVPSEINLKTISSGIVFLPTGETDPARIDVCREDECMTIETESRGQVRIFETGTP